MRSKYTRICGFVSYRVWTTYCLDEQGLIMGFDTVPSIAGSSALVALHSTEDKLQRLRAMNHKRKEVSFFINRQSQEMRAHRDPGRARHSEIESAEDILL